jgi:hypothetical protein
MSKRWLLIETEGEPGSETCGECERTGCSLVHVCHFFKKPFPGYREDGEIPRSEECLEAERLANGGDTLLSRLNTLLDAEPFSTSEAQRLLDETKGRKDLGVIADTWLREVKTRLEKKKP